MEGLKEKSSGKNIPECTRSCTPWKPWARTATVVGEKSFCFMKPTNVTPTVYFAALFVCVLNLLVTPSCLHLLLSRLFKKQEISYLVFFMGGHIVRYKSVFL